jgi:hypothetical protein
MKNENTRLILKALTSKARSCSAKKGTGVGSRGSTDGGAGVLAAICRATHHQTRVQPQRTSDDVTVLLGEPSAWAHHHHHHHHHNHHHYHDHT